MQIPEDKLIEQRPDWRDVLTASMRTTCVAPSDEAILYAFSLYMDDLEAPFAESELEAQALYSEITDGIAALQALCPEMVERALTQHAGELAYLPRVDGDDQ